MVSIIIKYYRDKAIYVKGQNHLDRVKWKYQLNCKTCLWLIKIVVLETEVSSKKTLELVHLRWLLKSLLFFDKDKSHKQLWIISTMYIFVGWHFHCVYWLHMVLLHKDILIQGRWA